MLCHTPCKNSAVSATIRVMPIHSCRRYFLEFNFANLLTYLKKKSISILFLIFDKIEITMNWVSIYFKTRLKSLKIGRYHKKFSNCEENAEIFTIKKKLLEIGIA